MIEQIGAVPPDSPQRTLVRGSDAVRNVLAPLVDRAQHDIALLAPQLPPTLFNTVAFARAFASFAARHRRNRGRVLLDDVQQALRDNDRLVELARRLSDTLSIRQVGEDDRGNRDILLIVDHSAYLQQHDLAHMEAIVDTRGGPPIAEVMQRFDVMWERSEPLAALNPIGL